jgi:hypothetical protein
MSVTSTIAIYSTGLYKKQFNSCPTDEDVRDFPIFGTEFQTASGFELWSLYISKSSTKLLLKRPHCYNGTKFTQFRRTTGHCKEYDEISILPYMLFAAKHGTTAMNSKNPPPLSIYISLPFALPAFNRSSHHPISNLICFKF